MRSALAAPSRPKQLRHARRRNAELITMLIPSLALLAVFSYIPMAGIVIAFQRFIPARGMFGDQQWVGLGNFRYAFLLPDFLKALGNTLFISAMKIVVGIATAIVFSLLLNELRQVRLKRVIQTVLYLPHFLSWVILASVFVDILSPSSGIVNRFLSTLGITPIFFLGSNAWFPYVLVITDTWKGFGFGTIVYLAAIASIDPSLYEAAIVDGANKLQQVWHITLPGMTHIIVLLALLSIGSLLNANFDQVFNMYSPQVYESGDVLDTLVYRIGILDANFGLSTAIGLFKSAVSFVLISAAYYSAYRFANYRVF